ncbi:1,4-dihydroxy-2-naphthoyl-CoA hydrolase [Microbacterium sp. SORGH_AS 1204]|uniref:PaaI family thioesterase n=1 Tax=Microbacterium sp. SORGH_AS_1204 TaxID=3041785 RepID=UPI00278F9D5B|nr:PaaI family thioesterase [Microbacterium sp. SORGH_AS_1204]MDQ1135916.1 1,4-dihydroxy-2-naphthoyl-CoA hydrolase [Microbacterium sp. SORGH_AS_1204]
MTWTIVPGALDERLGITVTAQSADRVDAWMPVEGNTQSLGRLHGGATAALAEAVGSWAAMIHASTLGKVCVGVDLNITHHRGARDGRIRAVATPAHRGRRVATYDIVVRDDADRLVATARITNLIVDPD